MDTWTRIHALAYSLAAIVAGAIIYFVLLIVTKTIKLEDLSSLPILKKFLKRTTNKKVGSQQEKGKGEKNMKKKKQLLWGLLILSLILSLPGIVNRFQVEWNNQTYEMVIPYQNIVDLVGKDADLEEEEILNRLKDSGIQAISIEPDTLRLLEHKGIVTNLTFEEIQQMSLFDTDLEPLLQEVPKDGLAVVIQEKTEITELLEDSFPKTKKVTFEGRDMILISGVERELLDHSLGYAPEVIELVRQTNLGLILRIPNEEFEEDQYLFDQALTLEDENTDRILFLGKDVLGSPDKKKVKQYTELLRDNGFGTYAIEFEDQGGFTTAAHTMYMDVVRLHSLALNEESPEEAVARAVRAVKERNIRSLFIKMDIKEDEPAVETLEKTEEFLLNVQEQMPGMFHLGKAEHFEPISVPLWSKAFALLAAVLFVSIAVLEILNKKRLFYLSIGGLGIISLVALILQKRELLQGFALLVALVTPVMAIVPVKGKEKQHLLLSYGRAILLSIAGIAIIVALLNGNEYLVKVDAFRGVKLIYIFPIAFMFIYAVWGNIKSLLMGNVIYWHFAVMAVLGVVALYYIGRTGNEGSVLTIELTFRQWLEELLYVRPRTKEFLIGFPLYVLALYLMPKNKTVALFLLVPGVIGFLSMVNTFTHLHIPLYVSILRTAYSLVVGLMIGYLFIFLYKRGYSLYVKQIKPRWFS
jgi:hypothetical protein